MHPKCVHKALHTKTLVFPASLKITSLPGSNIVSLGYSASYFSSSFVSLLIKHGVPFQTIYITSPGGNSPISISKYVSLSYLFHPLSLPIIPIANNLANDSNPPK